MFCVHVVSMLCAGCVSRPTLAQCSTIFSQIPSQARQSPTPFHAHDTKPTFEFMAAKSLGLRTMFELAMVSLMRSTKLLKTHRRQGFRRSSHMFVSVCSGHGPRAAAQRRGSSRIFPCSSSSVSFPISQRESPSFVGVPRFKIRSNV